MAADNYNAQARREMRKGLQEGRLCCRYQIWWGWRHRCHMLQARLLCWLSCPTFLC